MSSRGVVALFLFAFGVVMVEPSPAQEIAPGGRLFDGSGPLPVEARVRVSAALPPLEVRLLPPAGGAVAAAATVEPHEIGRLEIARPGEPTAYQTIVVQGLGSTERLVRFSRLEDANFDGYADLLLANDAGGEGAKWVGYQFYFFDPGSGTFFQDDLAREMSARLRGNELELQRITGGIALRQLAVGCQTGFVWLQRFIVEDGHLVQVEAQEQLQTPEGCYAVQRRRGPGGGLVEVARYPVAGNPSR